jgi:hypothetical protein
MVAKAPYRKKKEEKKNRKESLVGPDAHKGESKAFPGKEKLKKY